MITKFDASGISHVVVKNDQAEAVIALYGAHALSYATKRHGEILWMSSKSFFEPGKAIRGGIPVCWPIFGADPYGNLPQHGFARVSRWARASSDDAPNDESVTLTLRSSNQTKQLWPREFRLDLRFTLIGEALEISLKTTNLDSRTFSISEALHTYFEVSDAAKIELLGLDGANYLDRVNGGNLRKTVQGAFPVTAYTDAIFPGHSGEIIIEDPGLKRKIRLTREGSFTTVVWNPYEKAERMVDFDETRVSNMLCVEAANALENLITLKPGAEHLLTTRITPEDL